MSGLKPAARQWQVNGLRLAGLSWGEPTGRPLLALHGWLDNAASFSLLAPLLAGFHVVALDLTGHGLSDRRSEDATYQIWDDLPQILGVVDALGWDSFSLLGHSRGAIISSLLASTFPERVERLVLLDAVMPQSVAEEEYATQMRKFVQDKQRLLRRDTRVFESVEAAVATRVERGLSHSAARLLVERNLQACAGGYTWTTDPRLRGASAVKLTAGQNQAVLEALDMPTLLLMAQEGFGRHPEVAANAKRYIRNLTVEKIDGGHHFHMEACVSTVAQRIVDFLQGREGRETA
jgi:pimeloyl-ACP methyl ester carboxylesterase